MSELHYGVVVGMKWAGLTVSETAERIFFNPH